MNIEMKKMMFQILRNQGHILTVLGEMKQFGRVDRLSNGRDVECIDEFITQLRLETGLMVDRLGDDLRKENNENSK